MNKIFLYRLYKESKIFFLFAVLFILAYVIVLRKQMDMLLFPLNSMFSENTNQDFYSITYAVKLNGTIVRITNDFYLKKDFSESSLLFFSKWIKNGGRDLITELIERKKIDSVQKIYYLQKLTPPKSTAQTWPVWFLKLHHIQIMSGDNIEIWEYRFDLINNNFILKDSSLITKQILLNE